MGDLFNSIFDFLGGINFSFIEEALAWLYGLIAAVFQVLYQMLQQVANFFLSIAKAVAAFFKGLWENFFKNIFQNVWNAIKAGWKWLEAHLRPLIDFLKRLRKLYQAYFNTYIRPILVALQRIRQYLQILSLLHITIFQKLDQYLAQLQSKIVQAFATQIAILNTLIDIANALVDPKYLIRHPVLLLSIRRQIPALIHAVTGRPPGYWFPSPKGASGGPFSPPKFPFNFTDPLQNPATSTYLGSDDGIGDLSGFTDVFTFANGAVDQVAVLDYFNDDLYPDHYCPYGDPAKCLLYSLGLNV